MLSAHPDAPTPVEVAELFDFSSGLPPPLQGLAVENPIDAWYLLPLRAQGDFKTYLDDHPDEARAQLERYVVVGYPASSNLGIALQALLDDPFVLAVYERSLGQFSRAASGAGSAPWGATPTNHRAWLRIDPAWTYTGGHALIGVADTGIATEHPELRPFSAAGQFLGGNYLPVYGIDLGRWPNFLDFDPDEREPIPATHPACDRGDGLMVPSFAGHGTHVSGLIAASSTQGSAISGVCRHCGIAAWKIIDHDCIPAVGQVFPGGLASDTVAAAITLMSDIGIQAINMSFGFTPSPLNYCQVNPNEARCLALQYSTARQVLLVAAAGNHCTNLDFPARDERASAVGGLEQDFSFWDNAYAGQCGSNFTVAAGGPQQEGTTPAVALESTVYPGVDWNLPFECGDAAGGPGGDGYGWCTGTSMSSPLYAGIVGLLRSINPLVPPGLPNTDVPAIGIRRVIAQTSREGQLSLPWNAQLGYGRTDAQAAVERMLGRVAGAVVRNRATPLFTMVSTGARDHAYMTAPQAAVAFAIYGAASYSPQGALIPGYSALPNSTPLPVPRTNIFVLSTENAPAGTTAPIWPLYFFSIERPWPLGCTPGMAGCNGLNRDFLLATTSADVEGLNALGYRYRGRMGYVYGRCTPEPGCIPQGAQKLYRQCKPSDDDCAIFLESERSVFESQGFTVAVPAGTNTHIGYAYPNLDTDGDGLVDGFEYVIGTSPVLADSDGDGFADGSEFPLAAVATSDPCAGPLAGQCAADRIFANGFDPP